MIEAKSKQERRLDVLQHQVNVLIAANVEQDDKIEDFESRIEELEDRILNMDRSIVDLETELGRLEFDEDR